MRRILLFAAFFYFFIAPLTYHNDNKLVLFWASQNGGTVWNIWKWGETNLPPTKQFNYPPLHFYLAKLQYAIAAPIGGSGYTEWLASSDPTDPQRSELPRYMVATKFTLILVGVLCGYLIYLLSKKYGVSERRSKAAAILWLFNPVTIYSIPMMGQNDVLAIAVFLGAWLILAKRPWLSAILIGLAASIKVYPLLWFAFLLPVTPKLSPKVKVGLFCSAVFIYVLTLVPFMGSSVFRTVVLNSDINDRFLISQISIGFEQAINVVPLLLGILFFFLVRKKNAFSFAQQSAIVMTANLLLLGFTHFHPQWYTWVMPFWALWMSQLKSNKHITFATIASVGAWACWIAAIFLFQDKYLTFGMISVLNPALFNLPVLYDFLVLHGVNVGKFDNLAHTGLAGISLLALLSIWSPIPADPEDTRFQLPRFFIRVPKIIRFVAVFGIICVGTFVGTLVLQRVPVPQSSKAPQAMTYSLLNTPQQIVVNGEQPNLTRFDIFLRNPQLENKGSFEVAIYDKEISTLIMQQKISGRNVGDYTTLRFDLPAPRSNSLNRIYELTITPTDATQSAVLKDGSIPKSDEGYLLIGKKGEETNDVAVVTYYTSDTSGRSVLNRTVERIQTIFSQLWIFEIILLILLFVAI